MPCLAKALDLAGGASGSARDPAEPESAAVSEMSACFLFCGKDPFERAALTGDVLVAVLWGQPLLAWRCQEGTSKLARKGSNAGYICVAMISIDVYCKDRSMCVYCMMDTLGH